MTRKRIKSSWIVETTLSIGIFSRPLSTENKCLTQSIGAQSSQRWTPAMPTARRKPGSHQRSQALVLLKLLTLAIPRRIRGKMIEGISRWTTSTSSPSLSSTNLIPCPNWSQPLGARSRRKLYRSINQGSASRSSSQRSIRSVYRWLLMWSLKHLYPLSKSKQWIHLRTWKW